MDPIDEAIDHVRGTGKHLLVEYGDYECPYSRHAFREIQRAEKRLGDRSFRFAFRHFPLTDIHPHALAAAAAAEAAAIQGKFWEMSQAMYHHQDALEPDDLGRYATMVGLDVAQFERDRSSNAVFARVRRDVAGGDAIGEIQGTPTLYLDGIVHRGAYDLDTLLEVLAA